MGFLNASEEALEWPEMLDSLSYVKQHGLKQFIHVYSSVKDVSHEKLRWGDELEYGVFRLTGCESDKSRKCTISLRSPDIIEDLNRIQKHGMSSGMSEADTVKWQPEYGAWMLESTPGEPFEGMNGLLSAESSMAARRSRILSVLRPDEVVPTMTFFPTFGVGNFTGSRATNKDKNASEVKSAYESKTSGQTSFKNEYTGSMFVPDEVIFPHPRFRALSRNIRLRRQSKVHIARPKYLTPIREEGLHPGVSGARSVGPYPEWKQSIAESSVSSVAEADALPYVYADAMAFGMGCCCLQVTFQAKNLAESAHLYDHLAVLTPVMLALSAATPVLRGWLCDTDTRWDTVAMCVDDRTPLERGLKKERDSTPGLPDGRMVGGGSRRLYSSRYSPIDCYIHESGASYNDEEIVCDQEDVNLLLANGVSHQIAKHVAHLFARDPLVIFPHRLHLDDSKDLDHWESIQSTNWQTVRWKPPPSTNQSIGWRVEFRSMEIQLTDMENAAYVAFIVLLSRVILGLSLNLYLPMSLLNENMRRAQKRDAVLTEKFWFRRSLVPRSIANDICPTLTSRLETIGVSVPRVESSESMRSSFSSEGSTEPSDEKERRDLSLYKEMTLNEIMNGSTESCFPGLIPLCRTYLDFIGADSIVKDQLGEYLDLLSMRASGKLSTPAAWMRQFILKHPDYKNDLRVTDAICFDLVKRCHEIGLGLDWPKELFGEEFKPKRVIRPGVNPLRFSEGRQPHEDVYSTAKSACNGGSASDMPEKLQNRLLAAYLRHSYKSLDDMRG